MLSRCIPRSIPRRLAPALGVGNGFGFGHASEGGGEWLQFVNDDIGDQLALHAEVFVDDDVAQAGDARPRWAGSVALMSSGSERTASPMTARLRRMAS